MVTTRAFLTKNPELVQDFSDAMREALVMIQEKINDPDALLHLMPPEYQEAYKTEFAAQWVLAKPGFNADGTFSDKALADTVSFAKAVGVLKVADGTAFDPKKFFDNTYAEKSLAKTPSRKPAAR